MAEQVVVGPQELIEGRDDFLERLDYYCKIPACSSTPEFHRPRGPGRQRQLSQPWLQLRERANEDLGTPGAWYGMAAPRHSAHAHGSGMVVLNALKVKAATMGLENGKTLQINTTEAQENQPRHFRSVSIGGDLHSATWVDVEKQQAGGVLGFELSNTSEGLDWLTAEEGWMLSASISSTASAVLDPAAGLQAKVEVETTLDLGALALIGATAGAAAAAATAPVMVDTSGTVTSAGVAPGSLPRQCLARFRPL